MASQRTSKQAIQKVQPASGANYLAQYAAEDKSLAALQEFVIIPRLKIIQSMSDQTLKDKFGEGAVVIRPGDSLVWDKDQAPFQVVCLHFFTEYCKWADLNDKQSDSILDRSFDPASELAKRCADKELRYEVYAGDEDKPEREQRKYRYVQHLCFPAVIYGDHALAGTKCVLSFERGEFGQGRNFISAVSQRRTTVEVEGQEPQRFKTPLWAQVWELKTGFREDGSKKWYGFDFEAAGEVTEEHAPNFREDNLELQRLHEEKKLRVDHGGDMDGQGAPAPVEENAQY